MATFQFQTPQGTFEVDAPDQAAAIKAIQDMSGPSATEQADARAKAGIERAKAIMANGGPKADAVANVPEYNPRNYGRAGSAAMGAADATTFGYGDELASYLGSAISGLPRKQVIAEMRGDAKKAQADNPGSYLAGQIGGGLAQVAATGGAGFGTNAARAGGSLGKVALGSALDSAIYGGAYGSGSAEGGLSDRLKGGGVGALAGGALGGLAPVAISGILAAAKPLVTPLLARLQPQQYADAALAEALRRSGRTSDEIANALSAAQRDNQGMFTIADALGNAGQRMLSTAARNPHEGRQALVEALQQRQMGQGERLSNALAEGFNAPDTAAQRAASLTSSRNAAADVNYGAARQGASPVNLNDTVSKIDTLLHRDPIMGDTALSQGALGSRLMALRDQLKKGGEQLIDFNRVLNIKSDLYNAMQANPRVAGDMRTVYNELDKALESASGAYRNANDSYRIASGVIDAIDTGKAAASGRTRAADNIQTFGGMSPDQQNAFRAGYVDPMIAKVESAANSPTTNKARMLMTEKTGQEFPIFAAPGRADQMGSRIAREQRMFETANSALGGSKTADNLADAADLNKFDPSIMTNLMQGRPVAAVIAGVTKALNESRGLPPSVLTRLSRSLMETDPAAARLLLSTGTNARLSAAGRKAIYSAVLSRLGSSAAVPALTGN